MTNAEFVQQTQALIPAEVRMISGCEDYQTSADVSNVSGKLPDPAGRSGGACTSALLNVLYDGVSQKRSRFSTRNKSTQGLTFQEVLMRLREDLARDGYSQIPQLTSSRPLDLQDTPFELAVGKGARRALLVGINYPGQSGQLSGCHNDVLNVKQYIQKVHGFPEKGITVLLDDGAHQYPTRARMIRELQSLVAKSKAGDSVFFHYSGHGGLLSPVGNAFKNRNNEYDQTLIPVDHENSGQIRDFSLFNHFVQPMAAGVTVTCLMDCCHSGSVLDLPYAFKATNVGEAPRMIENVAYLSNLAFLYTLAGGVLPAGFEGIANYLGDVVGGNLDDYQGLGAEEVAQDLADAGDVQDYAPDYGAEDVQENLGYGDGDPVVVQGEDVDPVLVQGEDVFPDMGDRGMEDDVYGGGGYDFGAFGDQAGDGYGGDDGEGGGGLDFDGCDLFDFINQFLGDGDE